MRPVRFSPSMVVAVVAVVLSVTGSAVAARLVTGKQIQDGSITRSDLAKALRAQIDRSGAPGPRGPAGEPGVPGPAGQAGQPGAPGSALAYAHVNADGTLDPARSKNVVAVEKFTGLTGVYCITFGVTPNVLSATLNGSGNAGQITTYYEPGTSGCSFGGGKTYQAKVATSDGTGTLAARSFDIVVN